MRRFIVALAVLLLGLAAAPVSAQNTLVDEIEETKREIEDLNDRIVAAEQDASQYGVLISQTLRRMGEIEAELLRAERSLADLELSILETEDAIAFTQAEIILKENDLTATNEQIEAMHDKVVSQAVELFKKGGAIVASPLAFESSQEATLAVKYGSALLESTNRALDELDVLRSQAEQQITLIGNQKDDLNGQLGKLEGARHDAEVQRAIVGEKRNQAQAELVNQKALLQIIQTEITHFESELDALEAEEERLLQLLAESQRKDGIAPGELWPPLDGPIVSKFGPRLHPILGYSRLHAGIDIDGDSGDQIVAAATGDVILAGWYGGYGNAVIIDHGGGMATLYAHQSSLVVSKGQEVRLGDLIGYVGSTGLSTGPHLHFEVRINGKPVDPEQFFG